MAYTYRLAALLVLLSASVGFSSALTLKLNSTLSNSWNNTPWDRTTPPRGNINLNISLSVRKHISFNISPLVEPQMVEFNGTLSRRNISLQENNHLNIVWYGNFTRFQRAVIVDFIRSLNSPAAAAAKGPSVASWWKATEKNKGGGAPKIVLGKQLLLEDYPLGKSLKNPHLRALSGKLNGGGAGSITAVLTAKDVTVEGFCMNRCGAHVSKSSSVDGGAYVWVGNSEEQCPGYCAWPFHQPLNGPHQSPPLIAPNGDVGVDGMIINLATLLANTATNTYVMLTYIRLDWASNLHRSNL